MDIEILYACVVCTRNTQLDFVFNEELSKIVMTKKEAIDYKKTLEFNGRDIVFITKIDFFNEDVY